MHTPDERLAYLREQLAALVAYGNAGGQRGTALRAEIAEAETAALAAAALAAVELPVTRSRKDGPR